MSRTRHRVHSNTHRTSYGEQVPKVATAVCPHPEKAVYRTKRRAKRSLRRMTGVTGAETLRPYRCECGLFHLGHKPGSRKNRPRPAEELVA